LVAERLGVAFLDRGILTAVAQHMHLPEDAAAYDEQPPRGLFASLARLPIDDAARMDDLEMEEHRYRAETEEFVAAATESGGVVLGRGGQVILRGRPGVLHVFLGGPREARVQQAMELEGIDRRPRSGAWKPTTARGSSMSAAPMASRAWILTCTTCGSTAPPSTWTRVSS
jgi:hypothetical protein